MSVREDRKVDVQTFVRLFYFLVLLVLDIPWILAALECFELERCSMDVSAADELVLDSFQVEEPVVEFRGQD
jgi:hypothetical protein